MPRRRKHETTPGANWLWEHQPFASGARRRRQERQRRSLLPNPLSSAVTPRTLSRTMTTTETRGEEMTFKISAYTHHHGEPLFLRATMRTATRDEAAALVAQFPKSLRLHKGFGRDYGYVELHVDLHPTAATGTVNETGLKRYRSFRKHVARLGISTCWVVNAGNSITTEADFERLVGATR